MIYLRAFLVVVAYYMQFFESGLESLVQKLDDFIYDLRNVLQPNNLR